MMDLNIWTAAGLGLVVGFLAGVTLDDAFDMLRDSMAGRGRTLRLRKPEQTTLVSVGLAFVLIVNGLIGLALIQQRATADTFSRCLVVTGQAQRALDAIIFAVAGQDQHKMNDAIKDYVALRARPASELCGVRR